MKCPNCHIELKEAIIIKEVVDYCTKCEGVWLNKEKLKRILKRQSVEVKLKDNRNIGGELYFG